MLLVLNPTPLSAAFALGLIGIGYGIASGLAADTMARSTDRRINSSTSRVDSTSPGARHRSACRSRGRSR
jgi:hypothetical protein